ncbi:MAG: cbb3-type cytochrome c oxidase subunit I [Deltaproteobacteria bacterium]|nr:cbb3-type cytochrome c oxidase subunit I [Deltaproteobacteria bacterium]
MLLPNEAGSASRRFFLSSALWLFAGIVVALIAAIEMVAPDLFPAHPALTFGRMRPTHINLVVFGFLLSAYFGGFLYVVPRVCKTELFSERLANFAVWFWNGVVLAIAYALPHGLTQGREYAEAPWLVDVAVLAAVAVLIVLVFGTVARRKEKLLYVSVWYIAGGLVWTFFVYAVGNVVWDPANGAWEGMHDQILLWFYGHNVVGLVITPQAVALAYYILPRATRRPLYSHTLSLVGFWALIVMYTHTGTHHLLQAPVPQWLKVISIVNSIALLLPVFAFLTNVWLTVRGNLDKVFANQGAKFVFIGTVWYFLTCLQGPFHSLPTIQRVTHFTQWVVAHAHMALLGFAGSIAIGAVYYILPSVTGRKLHSERLADVHFWLTLVGGIGIFTSLTAAGLIQGEAWANGEVVYRVLSQLKVYFVVRGISGMLLLVGSLLFIYNVVMTILGSSSAKAVDEPSFAKAVDEPSFAKATEGER